MIYLVSADNGKIESYASLSRQSKAQYAIEHPYCVHRWYPIADPCHELGLSPCWGLVWAMWEAFREMREGDWMLFTGADAVIIDQKFDLLAWMNDHIKPDTWFAYTEDINGLNNNGFLLRKCFTARTYLKDIWALRGQTFEINGNRWEEQGAFTKLLEREDFKDGVQIIPQEITNGYEPCIYGEPYKKPVFIAHYPGKQTAERTYFIKRALGLVPRIPLPDGHWLDEHDVIRGPQ